MYQYTRFIYNTLTPHAYNSLTPHVYNTFSTCYKVNQLYNPKKFSTSAYFNINDGKRNKLGQEFSPGLAAVENIIVSKDSDYNKQLKIEETLKYLWKIEVENLLKNKSSLSKDNIGLRIIADEIKSLKEDINLFANDSLYTKYKPYFRVVSNMDASLILSIVLGRCITFAVRFNELDKQPTYNLFKTISEDILFEVVKEYYIKDKNSNKLNKSINLQEYSENKNLSLSEEEGMKLGLDLVVLLCNNSNFLELKEIKVDKNTSKRVLVTKEGFSELINNITLMDSEEMPMIIKPLPWEMDSEGNIGSYGGTILNNQFQYKPLRSRSQENSVVNNSSFTQDVIDSVNKIAGVKYSINTKLLDIITSNSYHKDDNSPLVYSSRHSESNKLSSYMQSKNNVKVNEILSHNSKFLYESTLINIAKLMSKVEGFYLTIFIDWRGRFYSSNCTLNIQGGELARSLLLFNKGEVLTPLGLKALKVYTANSFGLDKRSKVKRVGWVDQHLDEILDIPNNDLWLKADEPLIFLACAIELQGYYAQPKSFISRLPILMDASCNGLQHLSAMAQDITLAERVNLLGSKETSSPCDVYSDLIKPINKSINDLVEKQPEFSNLRKLNITRKLIKRGVMTITYGVTPWGISRQLLTDHFVKFDCKDNHNLYKPLHASLGKDVVLRHSDIYQLSTCIYNSLFEMHPSLNNIMNYFHQIVELYNTLNIGIRWLTPSGLTLDQKYLKFTKYDITNSIFKKRYKIVLRKPEVKNNSTVINYNKQINAFVPNFIHSMDGSNIVLLLKSMQDKELIDVATIHDCFGSQANHADMLARLVKESFISMYGDNSFIERLHSYMTLTLNNLFNVKDGKVILEKNDEILQLPIPNKPEVGKLDLVNELRKSQYFIS